LTKWGIWFIINAENFKRENIKQEGDRAVYRLFAFLWGYLTNRLRFGIIGKNSGGALSG
jgi:hypothetical protein